MFVHLFSSYLHSVLELSKVSWGLQWRSQKFHLRASSPFPSPSLSPFVPFSALPLLPCPFLSRALSCSLPSLFFKVGPPKIQLGDMGSAVSSPAEIEFGAF